MTVKLKLLDKSVYYLFIFSENLKNELPSVETIKVDLSNWKATKAAVEQSCPIDLLVNNAGVGIILPLTEVTEEQTDLLV